MRRAFYFYSAFHARLLAAGMVLYFSLWAPAAWAAPDGPPPEARRAGEEMARLLQEAPAFEDVLGPLRRAGVPYEEQWTVPRHFLLECRRGWFLAVTSGMYLADAAWAGGYGRPADVPVEEALSLLQLSADVDRILRMPWSVETFVEKRDNAGQNAFSALGPAAAAAAGMDDVRMLLGVSSGALLEETYLACRSAIGLFAEGVGGKGVPMPALAALARRVEAQRRMLQDWTDDNRLLRELPLYREIFWLESLQLQLELLQVQPSQGRMRRILADVERARSDLVRLCPRPGQPKKDAPSPGRLEDIFTPRTGF